MDLVLLLALSFGAGITIVLAVAGPKASSAPRRKRLERFATWTQQDFDEIQPSLRDQRRIDETSEEILSPDP